VRVISWNCCEGFRGKYRHLLDLDFDIAVVAECCGLDPDVERELSLTSVVAQPVHGNCKGLGVFARQPYVVTPLELPGEARPWLVAATVSGPVEVTLLAASSVATTGSCAAQSARVVTDLLAALPGPVLLAGDLNAPVDTSRRAHDRTVQALAQQGLVSAFTATRGVEQDAQLAEPTYYWRQKRELGYHVDHLFVPEQWTPELELTLGDFDTWVGTGRSEHVPLIADIAVPALVSGRA
jgi:hypothetical protein